MEREKKIIIGLILLAVVSRLIPHPPNFAPITGIALFAAAKLSNRVWALFLPLVCLFLSDLFLGISLINLFVYASFAIISLLGMGRKQLNLGVTFASSIVFFVVSNLGVWVLYYPKTLAGLFSCFTLAIPFYTNTLLGDLFYTAVLFGTYSFIEKRYLKAV